MKAASVREIKQELKHMNPQEIADLIMHLARFKKDNKELLTYLLFDSFDEQGYIERVKEEMQLEMQTMNRTSYYLMKKTIRKVLRLVKKQIRYSKKKETEVELLIHFCLLLQQISPSITRSRVLLSLYERQVILIEKGITSLHEDLQSDFGPKLELLKEPFD